MARLLACARKRRYNQPSKQHEADQAKGSRYACMKSDQSTVVAKTSKRGSKPGERRGGREKGTPNKATAEIRTIAQQYAPQAVQELARLAVEAESEQARVSAIKEILDRAYGKSTQPLSNDPDNPLIPSGIKIELIRP